MSGAASEPGLRHRENKVNVLFFCFFCFSQFSSNSTGAFKDFGPLCPDQPLVNQKNRAFKIPKCSDLACLDRLPTVSLCQN